MLSNLHTHTTFCDGNDTPEEMVLEAIDKSFASLGFSGHGYMDFDQSYCITDIKGYINEIKRLKEKYKREIQIYLGVEEDMLCPVQNRGDFEYIIGSSHYVQKDGKPFVLDIGNENFVTALNQFDGDIVSLAENYFSHFCDYILARRPDIIGHFDLLTKYDEKFDYGFTTNQKYIEVGKKYISVAAKADSFFEVNTGAIGRGWRTSQYPAEPLLHQIKKQGGKIVLNSDCHKKSWLDCSFGEVRLLLKDIGFECIYSLYNGEFQKDML